MFLQLELTATIYGRLMLLRRLDTENISCAAVLREILH